LNRLGRLYSPLLPFFDRSWRPSEIERATLESSGKLSVVPKRRS